MRDTCGVVVLRRVFWRWSRWRGEMVKDFIGTNNSASLSKVERIQVLTRWVGTYGAGASYSNSGTKMVQRHSLDSMGRKRYAYGGLLSEGAQGNQLG